MFVVYKQLDIRGVIADAYIDRLPEAVDQLLQWVKEVSQNSYLLFFIYLLFLFYFFFFFVLRPGSDAQPSLSDECSRCPKIHQ